MRNNRNKSWLLLVSFGMIVVAGTGCGDNRPKIVRPDNPSPIPDESMKLHIDTSHAPAASQGGDK